VTYSKRNGYRLCGWAVMETRAGLRSAGPTVEIEVPKKPVASPGGDREVRRAAAVPKVMEKCPLLAGYLLDTSYEGGVEPREPSYLIVKAAGGEWLVTLKDPTEARQIRLRVTDLGTAWATLEALLTSDTCPWEDDVWAAGRRPRKGGKRG
jgi:hypothetical protein